MARTPEQPLNGQHNTSGSSPSSEIPAHLQQLQRMLRGNSGGVDLEKLARQWGRQLKNMPTNGAQRT